MLVMARSVPCCCEVREGGYVAISRWESREVWEANRRDDVAPEAYAVFRRVCEVTSKQVLQEIAALGG